MMNYKVQIFSKKLGNSPLPIEIFNQGGQHSISNIISRKLHEQNETWKHHPLSSPLQIKFLSSILNMQIQNWKIP